VNINWLADKLSGGILGVYMACLPAKVSFGFRGVTVVTMPDAQSYKELPIGVTQNFRGGYFAGKYMYLRTFTTALPQAEYFKLKMMELLSRQDHNDVSSPVDILDEYQPFIETGTTNSRPVASGSVTSIPGGVLYYGRFACSIAVDGIRDGYDRRTETPMWTVTVTAIEVEQKFIKLFTDSNNKLQLKPISYSWQWVDQYATASPRVRAIVANISREAFRQFDITVQANSAELLAIQALKVQSEKYNLLLDTISSLIFEDAFELNREITVWMTESHKEVGIDQYEVSLVLTQALADRNITLGIDASSLIFQPFSYNQTTVGELKSTIGFSAIAQPIESGAVALANRVYQISALLSSADVATLQFIKNVREANRIAIPPVFNQISMEDDYGAINYGQFDVFLDIGAIDEVETNVWTVSMTITALDA
jgi:hypothetical protein